MCGWWVIEEVGGAGVCVRWTDFGSIVQVAAWLAGLGGGGDGGKGNKKASTGVMDGLQSDFFLPGGCGCYFMHII